MKKRILLLAVAVLLIGCSDDDKSPVSAPFETTAQTDFAIPDDSEIGIESPIEVTSDGTISNPEGISVTVELNHPFAGDVVVELVTPDGQSMPLIKRIGYGAAAPFGLESPFAGGNFLVFTSAATTTISTSLTESQAVPGGTYLPTGTNDSYPTTITMINMHEFLDGKSVAGIWKLRATDHAVGEAGSLLSWKLRFEEGALHN
ncbi:proprotein convertase P-domain-containing protein [Flavobacterium silvaticum]|uniref:P/Homo B domain-containing protein n=1 Tax=Flavobacterium silvaticum TaxID=1852020 RepID=A0A972JJW3_9FLAO|nr:proprotein convertase P-domain-containing protein [Flavobacterium silvaticum]NMH28512.1 hypothetical protein [Flavobacterium silvaticum]